MSNAKHRLLAGTILSALVLGSINAAPLEAPFVMAQAPPQSEQDKKPPQPPGQPPPRSQSQPPQQRQVQPPPQQRQVPAFTPAPCGASRRS